MFKTTEKKEESAALIMTSAKLNGKDVTVIQESDGKLKPIFTSLLQ